MAETIVRTFSILIETDHKMEQIAKETFVRIKGNVIDWAVDDLWKKLHPDGEGKALEPVPAEIDPQAPYLEQG